MQWCRDKSYRDDLLRRRYNPHVRPINEFVDRLRDEHPGKFIPYVAPTYGGVNARMLSLLQDPGPKTNPKNNNGSEMLCIENDDPSAERYKMFLSDHGIDVCDIQAWNAFPWYVSKTGKYNSDGASSYPEADVTAATEALATMLSMLPRLRVVLLHGNIAKEAWARVDDGHPDATGGIKAINSWHTSPRVVDPKTKPPALVEKFTRELTESFAAAAKLLRDPYQEYDVGDSPRQGDGSPAHRSSSVRTNLRVVSTHLAEWARRHTEK